MLRRDPLEAVERASQDAERQSVLRHAVRNKLASVRNATYYLKRRTSSTPLWTEDPRVQKFFELIESELGGVETLLSEPTDPLTPPPQPGSTDMTACIALAVEA